VEQFAAISTFNYKYACPKNCLPKNEKFMNSCGREATDSRNGTVQETKRQERRMKIEMTDQEQKLLLELVEAQQKQIIQELDHADSRDYKAILRDRLQTLEGLLTKVQSRAA